jgi:hypothetical protein
MTARTREEIVMTATEQGHRRPECRDVEVADERAATLAALSGELTQRLSKHPLPPPRHALEREPSRGQALWRMGLLSALGVALCIAVAGLAGTPFTMIWKELERFGGQPADTSLVPSTIVTVSTAAAATAPSPQSAAPPIDPPTIASAPVHGQTAAASRVDDLVERELTWTEVHELQIRLRALKFDPGPPDGVKGPLTSAAVRRFQESQGDRATGDIGLRTLIRVRQATTAP